MFGLKQVSSKRLPDAAAGRKRWTTGRRLLALLCLGIASAPHAAHGEQTSPQAPSSPPDFSRVPGVVIHHSPQTSGIFIGSPSIAILPSGDYVASHDEFGPNSSEHTQAVTHVYRSADRGAHWQRVGTIHGQFWSTLFVHRQQLYILGTWKHHGPIVLRRSEDGGRTWTTPRDAHSGLLAEGEYHCGPQPVLTHAGRLWRAMEDAGGGTRWGERYSAMMMSVPVDADLLDAAQWTLSQPLRRDPTWLEGAFQGWLEGNAVVDPQGRVCNILRVERGQTGGTAALVQVSADGRSATFNPETGFIAFPGGAKKFTIRFDPPTRRYWSLANWVPAAFAGSRRAAATRNTLALTSSDDLRHWKVERVVLQHEDAEYHGFQYADWQIEGDDLIAVVRTASDDGLGGARNHHDANFLTFHRISNFRQPVPTSNP